MLLENTISRSRVFAMALEDLLKRREGERLLERSPVRELHLVPSFDLNSHSWPARA